MTVGSFISVISPHRGVTIERDGVRMLDQALLLQDRFGLVQPLCKPALIIRYRRGRHGEKLSLRIRRAPGIAHVVVQAVFETRLHRLLDVAALTPRACRWAVRTVANVADEHVHERIVLGSECR